MNLIAKLTGKGKPKEGQSVSSITKSLSEICKETTKAKEDFAKCLKNPHEFVGASAKGA